MIGRLAVLWICAALLAGCHGSTLDAITPDGSLGHTLPPAANLPPGDCPPNPTAANLCAE
jgi:hypothetical protein